MTRAYLLSFLTRQRLLLEQRFDARYPHHLLVWEPGKWKAPPANASVADTRFPAADPGPMPVHGDDALCFELKLMSVRTAPLRIGRGDASELVIADATVSREHCTLRLVDGRWLVRTCDGVKATKVDGQPLAAGAERPLSPGQQLDLGDVKLTFLDPKRFCDRVAAEASHLRQAH